MSTTVVSPEGFAWSYSQLKNFEACPRRYYNYNVSKDVKEPESGALLEGKKIHEAFDARVSRGTKLPLDMQMHEPLLARLAAARGEVRTECKLALTSDFTPSKFFGRGVWFRIMLDYVNTRDSKATVIDYKTGKPDNADMTQLQLAAVTMFAHDAKLEKVRTALVFVAYDQVERVIFTRDDISEIWGEILPRVGKMVEARQAQDYPPKPGRLCRSYCAVTSCPFHGK